MKTALRLAARGAGWVSPNPMVGAVVVREGRIVGRGWHRRYGAPHAEVEALNRAGEQARGADLYVTLEPCNHHGLTPPCTAAILAAGVARVVVATLDPNPRVAGGGAEYLTSWKPKPAASTKPGSSGWKPACPLSSPRPPAPWTAR